jgi:hypothetical protein
MIYAPFFHVSLRENEIDEMLWYSKRRFSMDVNIVWDPIKIADRPHLLTIDHIFSVDTSPGRPSISAFGGPAIPTP